MERRGALAPFAGIGAAIILGGVALAAATQSGGTAAPLREPAPDAPPGVIMPGVFRHALLGRIAEQLDLSPAQRQAIRGLFDQAKPGFAQLRRQMQAGAELLARTAPDDPAYQSVVANVSQSAADLAAEFVLQASQLRSQVHGVLTPEQRTRLAALEADRLAGLLEHRRGRPADDGPPVGDGGPKGPQ